MSPDIHQLGIDAWSVDDRLHLIGEIWDSLENVPLEIPEAHREELDRRLDAADADPNAGAPMEEVMARLRARQ